MTNTRGDGDCHFYSRHHCSVDEASHHHLECSDEIDFVISMLTVFIKVHWNLMNVEHPGTKENLTLSEFDITHVQRCNIKESREPLELFI